MGETDNIDESMKSAVTQAIKQEQAIHRAVHECKETLRHISELEEKSTECEIMLSRFSALDSQYTSDISRLLLIADGKNHLPDIADVNTESINAELNRILAQRDGLLQVIQELYQEKEAIEQELAAWKQRQNEIHDLVNRQLHLEICEPISQLEGYREALEAKGRWQVIKMLRELAQISENQDGLQYCPHKYFPSKFSAAICEYAEEVLQPDSSAPLSLDIENFRLTPGCPYHNAVVLIALRSYLANKADVNPGLLMLDLSSNAGAEKDRAKLYQYLQNHSGEGQVIIAASSAETAASITA